MASPSIAYGYCPWEKTVRLRQSEKWLRYFKNENILHLSMRRTRPAEGRRNMEWIEANLKYQLRQQKQTKNRNPLLQCEKHFPTGSWQLRQEVSEKAICQSCLSKWTHLPQWSPSRGVMLQLWDLSTGRLTNQ